MSATTAWLAAWFKTRTPDVELAPSDNFFDREAIDSFGVIELIEDIEAHFAVRFVNDSFQDRRFPTIAGLAAMIDELQHHG